MEELDKIFDDFGKSIGVRYRNYVAIILDKSGSMESMRKEALDMYNNQVKALKNSKADMETYVSFITFNENVDEKVWCEDVDKAKEMTMKNYQPNGGTALFDAVGYTIEKFLNMEQSRDENTSFLFLIITDGEENSSQIFKSERLSELILDVQKTDRWTFTYLGTSIDLSKVQKTMNLDGGNTLSYMHLSSNEMKDANDIAYCATVNFMEEKLKGVKSVKNYYSGVDSMTKEEREKLLNKYTTLGKINTE